MIAMLNLFKRKPKEPDLSTLSDPELVELAKENKVAFGVLYVRYVEKIYKYIYYRTGNHQDAEDLCEAVFFRAMGHIETYTDRGLPFQAWLYRIAHNLVANWHRDKGRRKVIPLEDFVNSGWRTLSTPGWILTLRIPGRKTARKSGCCSRRWNACRKNVSSC